MFLYDAPSLSMLMVTRWALAVFVIEPIFCPMNQCPPQYRSLSTVKRGWWCADLAHLVFSTFVSVSSLAHVLTAPGALLPWRLIRVR